MSTVYDSSNQEHVSLLQRLWKAILPKQTFESDSLSWKLVGFQKTDPTPGVYSIDILYVYDVPHTYLHVLIHIVLLMVVIISPHAYIHTYILSYFHICCLFYLYFLSYHTTYYTYIHTYMVYTIYLNIPLFTQYIP